MAVRAWFLPLVTVCLLVACSPHLVDVQKMRTGESHEGMQRRLQDVGLPLLIAAVEWCPFEQDATYGFLLRDHPASGDDPSQRTMTGPVVAYVHQRLPAASTGLALGDRIIEVNTTKVEGDDAGTVMRLISRLTAARIQPLQLEVERDSTRRLVTMWALPICKFSLRLVESDLINGVSNGRAIAVTTGAMQIFSRDDEVAWVLAHEVAHNILSHAQNAQLRVMLNAFLRATVGAVSHEIPSPESRSLEVQADYVGAYLMARAGYDLDAVRRVWERLGAIERLQSESGRAMTRTHPTTAERLTAFQETFKEIMGKRQRGELLQPQLPPRD